MNMTPTEFGIVGAGWRAEFFLRIAAATPNWFRVTGLVRGTSSHAEEVGERFGVPVFASVKQLIDATRPSFVITSVPRDVNPALIRQIVDLNTAVLSETPPAPTVEGLNELWKDVGGAQVQVAEQYIFQPHHAARLNLVATGKLGRVSQAQVSVAHGYHGVSLIRHFLGVTFEDATVETRRFQSPLVEGPGRYGGPTHEAVKTSSQDITIFDFGDRLGIFDFTGDQYFSWVRGQRLLVRGERGEIIDLHASYLRDFKTPIHLSFVRHETGANGNLEGKYLKGIQAGEEWLYENPLAPATLSDDEIAVGTSLLKMARYVETGEPFYPLAEACQDTYLALVALDALEQGRRLTTTRQSWCDAIPV
ncbi:MAG: Gfo/Idh/MocA family oxidoreductase [Anaerolineae bacterium]